jgi:hypothetical protein
MKIYFAIPMISGKSPAVPYKEIRDFLVENGHQVLTEHLLEEGAWESESQLPREFIFLVEGSRFNDRRGFRPLTGNRI